MSIKKLSVVLLILVSFNGCMGAAAPDLINPLTAQDMDEEALASINPLIAQDMDEAVLASINPLTAQDTVKQQTVLEQEQKDKEVEFLVQECAFLDSLIGVINTGLNSGTKNLASVYSQAQDKRWSDKINFVYTNFQSNFSKANYGNWLDLCVVAPGKNERRKLFEFLTSMKTFFQSLEKKEDAPFLKVNFNGVKGFVDADLSAIVQCLQTYTSSFIRSVSQDFSKFSNLKERFDSAAKLFLDACSKEEGETQQFNIGEQVSQEEELRQAKEHILAENEKYILVDDYVKPEFLNGRTQIRFNLEHIFGAEIYAGELQGGHAGFFYRTSKTATPSCFLFQRPAKSIDPVKFDDITSFYKCGKIYVCAGKLVCRLPENKMLEKYSSGLFVNARRKEMLYPFYLRLITNCLDLELNKSQGIALISESKKGQKILKTFLSEEGRIKMICHFIFEPGHIQVDTCFPFLPNAEITFPGYAIQGEEHNLQVFSGMETARFKRAFELSLKEVGKRLHPDIESCEVECDGFTKELFQSLLEPQECLTGKRCFSDTLKTLVLLNKQDGIIRWSYRTPDKRLYFLIKYIFEAKGTESEKEIREKFAHALKTPEQQNKDAAKAFATTVLFLRRANHPLALVPDLLLKPVADLLLYSEGNAEQPTLV